MTASPIVSVQRLSKSYGRRRIFSDLNFDICRGQLVGIVGENGAGKSTLLKCLVGLLRPNQGTISLGGRLGYCPQEPLLLEILTCAEQFELFGAGYGLACPCTVERALALMDVFNCRQYLHTRVDQLSGGTRQKINLIVALLHDPEIVILDEPYQGFDRGTYVDFWEHVDAWRAQGKAVLVVTHLLAELSRVDRVVELRVPTSPAGGDPARREPTR